MARFRNSFTHDELSRYVAAAVDVMPVTAAPGVLYIFRRVEAREAFLASTMRRTMAPRVPPYEALYSAHRMELERLADFIRKQGRVPVASDGFETRELEEHCGTIGRAFLTLRKIYGPNYWLENAERARQDLMVYLALAKFRGRSPFTQLPEPLREDIRAHFGTYAKACNRADELLFGVGNPTTLRDVMENSGTGKLTPGGLYIHKSALSAMGPVLRTYEGCGRVLVGTIESCNVIKLHRSHFGVSYLYYPEFERDPHPALAGSVHVDLRARQVRIRDYANSENPPILHRKELFVAPDHPFRTKFQKLTAQEEKLHLLDDAAHIGTRRGWAEVLVSKGLRLNGHVVRRTVSAPVTSPIPDSPD